MSDTVWVRAEVLASLHGLVAPEVGLRLAGLAKEVPADRVIVELGSYHGKSTCYLAEGARIGRGAHVYAIDAWDLPGNETGRHGYAEPNAYTIFRQQVDAMALGEQITPIRAFSHEPAREWERTVGLLFIDASHLYRDVKRDYEAWSPHVGDGGVIAFDDYGTKRNPGVTEFVRELVAHDVNIIDWDFHTQPLAIARRMLP